MTRFLCCLLLYLPGGNPNSEADLFCWGDGGIGEWRDVDEDQNSCAQADYKYNLPNCYGTDCDVPSGEAGVGEYNSVGADECCGDDANEYFIIKGIGADRCCAAANRCVDSGGACRGGVENTAGLCSNGVDDDCDGKLDCLDLDCTSFCCGTEGDACCSTGDACEDMNTLYCTGGHCCTKGSEYWDPTALGGQGDCVEGASKCGLKPDTGWCGTSIASVPGWIGDSDCYTATQGCCEIFLYGEDGYYFTDITTY